MSAAVVRDGSEKDRDQILSLRRAVFGETEADKLDPRFWKWQFLDGPDGAGLIHLVEDASSVVGHFADVPHRFFRNGQPLLGTLSIDLMVHPDHRRQGLFLAMGQHAAERVRREGGSFTFAFPIRDETIRGFRKLGWTTAAELPVLVHPVRFRSIVQRYLRWAPASAILGGLARLGYAIFVRPKSPTVGGEIRCEEIRELDDLFDPFWQGVVKSSPMVSNRTRAFLQWRYLDHPTRTYVICRAMRGRDMTGLVVLREVEVLGFNSAIVVDLLAHDEESVKCLLTEALRFGRRAGTDLVGFMVPAGHAYDRIARSMGFLASGKKFLLMVHSLSPEPDLAGSTPWYVNWGDTDVM